MNDRIKQLLKDLGTAINESISNSEDVNRHIQEIRDHGYDLYVVLDATIGLNPHEEEAQQQEDYVAPEPVAIDERQVQFRINVNDLSLLRSLGIDPTRKVRSLRRIEPLQQGGDENSN